MSLIGHREGVYGRQATPEEEIVLQEFARQWVADEPKRRERDHQRLKELMKKYEHGRPPTSSELFD